MAKRGGVFIKENIFPNDTGLLYCDKFEGDVAVRENCSVCAHVTKHNEKWYGGKILHIIFECDYAHRR